MRSLLRCLGLFLSVGGALASGCSSASSGGGGSGAVAGSGATGGGGTSGSGGVITGGTAGVGGVDGGGTGGIGPDAACKLVTAEAKQAPAAMLFVVDGSASMAQLQKWGNAQAATIAAIDKGSFDNTSLGLVRFPATFMPPPQCFCDYACAPLGGCDIATCTALLGQPGVACGVSFLPQVPISDSGTQKSNQGGVRKAIYDYLANPQNGPVSDASDASPIYDAMVAGYTALASAVVDRRIMVLITDGGFSCTSVASPARPGLSDGACLDWEQPESVIAMIKQKYSDATKPTFTFVVGVPGSNSTGDPQGSYSTAPYTMLNALSAYAYEGSPNTAPIGCDHPTSFPKGAAPPALPCHFDLSNASTFNADILANAIDQIRGSALGCVYDIPDPGAGQVIDKGEVNVDVTIDGTTSTILKRSDPKDTCDTVPCWDYKGDKQIELIGKACADLSKAKDAKVEIYFGCITLVK